MECLPSVFGVVPDSARGQRVVRPLRQIGITLFDGFSSQEATTIARAFQLANALLRASRSSTATYDVRLLSAPGGMVASSSTMLVWTESTESCRHGEGFDVLFIVGGAGVHHALCDERLVDWLRYAVPRCRLTSPIGEGHLLLDAARSALANCGRAVGEGARNGAQRSLEAAAYANFVGPLRMALDVIQGDLGTEIVNQIAAAVVPPTETQFTALVRKSAEHFLSERIQASVSWMLANASGPVVMCKVAGVAAMSERNFLRRFKVEMGVTPSEYLMYARLDMCCRLLVETNLSVNNVAERCGIGSGGQLSKLLRKHLATTATAYRADARRAATQPSLPPASFAQPVMQTIASATASVSSSGRERNARKYGIAHETPELGAARP